MHQMLEPREPASSTSPLRLAQADWARVPVQHRLCIVRNLRHLIAEKAEELGAAAAEAHDRPLAEKLVSEVLPLAEACRWLERHARRVLAPRRHGREGRPWWLSGVTSEVQRQPLGVVLVIGPGNYPLFLPAVHALQALVAGNAVLLKPAPGTRGVAMAFQQLAIEAGLPPELLTVLPESVEAARDAITRGVDKVVFTGSSPNGRAVLRQLAETNTPSVMELSGEDAFIVLADADLDLVVRALRFGQRLNAGNTCIAPRRLIVAKAVADKLLELIAGAGLAPIPFERVLNEEGALARVRDATFALGASIFSRDVEAAQALAVRLKTGFVVINDLIVPTADPRLPFGGVKASGFGSTRGEEGLLEMTFPHVVTTRRSRLHPHFDEPAKDDAQLFASYLRAAHGPTRLSALGALVRAIACKITSRKETRS